MRSLSLRLLTVLALTAALWSCKTVKEELQVEPVADYLPLQPGKYITYRLDSTVFTLQGRDVEIHYYEEKHVIDAQFMDNQGRPTYRVYRYLRDTSGTKPWSPAGTYMITPLAQSIEVIEDNMRVVKLVTPVRKGYTWHGNQYLVNEPYATKYSFGNDNYMRDWEFSYESTNDVFTYQGQDLPNVLKVVHVDERADLDTVVVTGNFASVPDSSQNVWLKEGPVAPTDTIIIDVPQPPLGYEQITIWNQTSAPATLNGIVIPAGLSLYFEYNDNKWFYPNPLTVVNNAVTLPSNTSLAYLLGTATADINVDATRLDTMQTKLLTIYNRTDRDAFLTFHPDISSPDVSSFKIPPGKGRNYQLTRKQWGLYEDQDVLLHEDPYSTDLPYTTTNYGVEKYAKGIGMVYQELLMWEYQPNTGGTAFKVGFGVKRSMIDHN